MIIEKIKKIICKIKFEYSIIILFAAPLISLLWHLENKQLPLSDAIGYLDSASIIYQNLMAGNFSDFIVSIFNERSWRPVIFQLFIVPFLVISNGDLLTSVMMTHFIFVSLSVFIIYKIFLISGSKYTASISAAIVCLSIDIFFGGTSYPLFAEVSFIPFLLSTLYLLSDENLFQKKKKSYYFVLFFTLTMLSRPIEGALFLGISLISIIIYQHKKYLYIHEIVKGFFWPVLFLWVLFFSRLYPNISSSVLKIDPPYSYELFFMIFCCISLVFLVFLIYFLYVRLYKISEKKSNLEKIFFSKSMFLSSFILWFWYTPRFGSLYGWVYDTSIGNQFQYQKDQEYSALSLLNSAVNSHGSFIIYAVVILFLITIGFSLKQKYNKSFLFNKDSKIHENVERINILFLTSALIPTILYFVTHQVTYRKIAPVITMAIILMIIHIIKSNNIKSISNSLLAAIFLCQIYFFYNHIYGAENNERWLNQHESIYSSAVIGSGFPRPINVTNDSYVQIVEFLKNQSNIAGVNNIGLVLSDNSFPIEPYLLKFFCNRASIKCSISSPKNFKYGDIEYLKNNDAILIIHDYDLVESNSLNNKAFAKNEIESNLKNSSPYELYSYYLTYLHVTNTLDKHKITVIKCQNIYKAYQACLLIKD